MDIQRIKTPSDHTAALKEIDALMSAERGTAEGRRLETLAKFVQEYEAKHFPLDFVASHLDEKECHRSD